MPGSPTNARARRLAAALALLVSGCSEDAPTAPLPAPAERPALTSGTRPAVVELPDTTAMDPGVVALIEEHLARVRAAPEDGALQAELGLAYEANRMWREAELCYANAAERLPDKPEWRYRLAVAKRANGDLQGAIAVMLQVASEITRTPVIQARLGDMLLEAGRLDEAEAALQRGLDVSPPLPQGAIFRGPLLVLLARAELRNGDADGALDLAQRAVELDPADGTAHYALGLAHQAKGETEAAEHELRLGVGALKRFPPDPHDQKLVEYAAGYGRRMGNVEVLLQEGQVEEALARLADLRRERPDDHFVLNLLARAKSMTGDTAGALELLQQSAELDPNAHQTQEEMAVLLINAGRLDEAIEHAERAAELAPTLGRPHYFRGIGLMFKGDTRTALQAFLRAEELGCPEAALYGYIAQLYGSVNDAASMYRYAKLAVEKMPEEATAHLLVAQSALALSRLDEARRAIAEVKRIQPTDPRLPQIELALRQTEEQ